MQMRRTVALLCVLLSVTTMGVCAVEDAAPWTPPANNNNIEAPQATLHVAASAMGGEQAPPCEGDGPCHLPEIEIVDLCDDSELCDETMIEDEKRSNSFSTWGGKRAPAFSNWGGKRAPAFSNWGGKRAPAFSNWGGKRAPAFSNWGGKRVPFTSWGGKRVPFTTWGGKRVAFSNWGGKRSDDENNKRGSFNSWGGKRVPFTSWGGKRSADAIFSSWGGKRAEMNEDPRDKRATSGKRNPNPRSKNDIYLSSGETVAIRRGTVDFFPWGGKRSE